MSVADSAMTRQVLRHISKHPIDISGLEVHVIQGVVYLQGRLARLRGYHEDLDLEEELNSILKILRQSPGIRDVCCEVELSELGLRERMFPRSKRA